jgi:hypothetical protein
VAPDWPLDHVEIIKKHNNLMLGWLSAVHIKCGMTDRQNLVNLKEIAFATSNEKFGKVSLD